MRPIQALLDFPTWQLHHPLSLHPLHSVHMHRPFVSFCCSEWGCILCTCTAPSSAFVVPSGAQPMPASGVVLHMHCVQI